MNILSDFKIVETGCKTYPYALTFTERLKYVLRKYCFYRTFYFKYVSKESLIKDAACIRKEIEDSYQGKLNLKLNL